MNQLAQAIAITALAFKDIEDKGGTPYVQHCLYVMYEAGGDVYRQCAAVMHDLVEDTDWTIEKLRKAGFNERILDILKLVTHDPKEPYMDYIKRLSFDEDAREIKKADLKHNTCVTRLKGLRKKDFERLEKYMIAYTYLKEI